MEADLCEREFKWVNRDGVDVKRLEPKVDFRKRVGRSPDDGDGFVMAVAPERLFRETSGVPRIFAGAKGRG